VKTNRVVVLGDSGFVGRWTTSILRDSGFDVRGYASKQLDLLSSNSVAKLREAVQKDDVLVIVSALTPDRGRDVRTMSGNIRMVEHLCELLNGHSCAHVVYVSSDAVYADDVHLVRETSCCDPSTFHGLMHLVRERALQTTLKQNGTPLWIVRPCAIYGVGDTHNSYGPNRFVRSAKAEGRIRLFGNGEERRDHVNIRDVARLISVGLEQRSEGIMNIASGETVSFFDVARMVADVAGRPIEIETSPRQSPITHRRFDITRLIRLIPSFRFTALRDGIAEMMKSTNDI
jgi:nucleoside-diphosphate-sugar epimerase